MAITNDDLNVTPAPIEEQTISMTFRGEEAVWTMDVRLDTDPEYAA